MTATATPDTIEQIDIGHMIDAIFDEADLYKVIVWNDDVTTFEQVITALVTLFDHTPEKAEELAWTVHRTGKAIAAVLEKDAAERGVQGLHAKKIQASLEKA